MSTDDATDSGDPVPTCGFRFGSGVWFSFTPASNGVVSVSTCGSSFDTVVQVYSGMCSEIIPMGCNDNYGPGCFDLAASVRFLGTGGVTYWILGGGSFTARGTLRIMAEVVGPPDAPSLSIKFTRTNTVVVSWPSPSTGVEVQQNTLNTTNWVTPSEPVADDGTNKFLIVNPPTGHRFYRLFRP